MIECEGPRHYPSVPPSILHAAICNLLGAAPATGATALPPSAPPPTSGSFGSTSDAVEPNGGGAPVAEGLAESTRSVEGEADSSGETPQVVGNPSELDAIDRDTAESRSTESSMTESDSESEPDHSGSNAAVSSPSPTTSIESRPPSSVEPPALYRSAELTLSMGVMAGAGALAWSGFLGANLLDSPNSDSQDAGRLMFVPLVGPFVAAGQLSGVDRGGAITLGVLQVGAAVATGLGTSAVIGKRRYDRSRGHRRSVDRAKIGVPLISAGLVTMGIAYAVSAGLTADERRRGASWAQRALVPVVGGFWAAASAPRYSTAYGMAFSSSVQVMGLASLTAGAALLAVDRRKRRSLVVLPGGDRNGVRVTATWRF